MLTKLEVFSKQQRIALHQTMDAARNELNEATAMC